VFFDRRGGVPILGAGHLLESRVRRNPQLRGPARAVLPIKEALSWWYARGHSLEYLLPGRRILLREFASRSKDRA